jgi:cyclopropane fatty-acyl-phospholipid synthase-like methyltransferase
MKASLDFSTAPGYQVLAAAGKKILRPGGRLATEQLFTWADFKPGETVLELASSYGESAISIAKRFNVSVVGVEQDPASVTKARANIEAAGLSVGGASAWQNRVSIVEGDIFQLDRITDKFDYILAEAILTMQSNPGKAKILSIIRDRLKPSGKFLAHELLVRSDEAQVRKNLSQAIRVNANPLSLAEWRAACENAGLTLQQQQTGSMKLLNLSQIIRDEGILRTVKIAWNILTNPDLRHRILQIRSSFQQYQNQLGYIIFWAKVI